MANGHDTVVNRLLKAGADVNIPSGCSSALEKAAANGHETVVDIWLKAEARIFNVLSGRGGGGGGDALHFGQLRQMDTGRL